MEVAIYSIKCHTYNTALMHAVSVKSVVNTWHMRRTLDTHFVLYFHTGSYVYIYVMTIWVLQTNLVLCPSTLKL